MATGMTVNELASTGDARQGRAALWTGRVLSALILLLMASSGVAKVIGPPAVVEGFRTLGYPAGARVPIGVAEIACAILFAIPQTSVLGGILLAGYLGGAVATHVHASQGFAPAVLVGIAAWVALYLREPRLRSLVPLRR